MLVDFTVENYRSISEPVTLTAIAATRGAGANVTQASRRRYKTDEEIAPARPAGDRGFCLLPVMGIFGANASGKSNLLLALNRLLFLMSSGWSGGDENSSFTDPFRLTPARTQPRTAFTMRVLIEDHLYTYALQVDSARIILEQLDYVPPAPARSRLLYRRQYNPATKSYDWKLGDDFSGPHTMLRTSVRERQTFLGLLISGVVVEVIQPLEDWLWAGGQIALPYGITESWDLDWVAQQLHGDDELRQRVVTFLQNCDTGIDDILIEHSEPGDDGQSDPKIVVVHQVGRNRVTWSIYNESLGTRRLVPLALKVLRTLRSGGLQLADELGPNIHPHLTRRIVRLFQNPETNPYGAQLVFTSHDASLHDNELLRRDQVWITQRRDDLSTDLCCLSEFRVRRDLNIEHAYLDGRFGGVPLLPAENAMLALHGTNGSGSD